MQQEVAEIIKDRFLVGHAIENDLRCLMLQHPRRFIRDTATYKPFKVANNNQKPSLKLLASSVLGMEIQDGSHSSVEDAWAAMMLYKRYRKEWESSLSTKSSKVAEEEDEDEPDAIKPELADLPGKRIKKPKLPLWKRRKMQKERAMNGF